MLDAMCRPMSTKAARRNAGDEGPLAVFFNILDVAGINAWIVYREVTGSIMWRRDFLHQLSGELCVLQRRTVTRQWICSRCRRRRCSNHGSTVRSRRSATATELLLCVSVVIVQCAANVWQTCAQYANENMVLWL